MCSPRTPLLILAAALLPLSHTARAVSPSGSAAPSKQDLAAAKRHFSAAKAFYDAGDYRTAKEEFEEAYRLSRMPDLLFNLARTEEKMEHFNEAIAYLERYLVERPNAKDEAAIRAQIESLRDRLPPPEPEKPAPPPVVPVIAAPQAMDSDRPPLDGGAGRAALQRRPSGGRVPWPAVTLLAGGAALLAIGAGLGGGALVAANEVGDPSKSDRYFDESLQATERRGKALEASAIGMFISGAIAFTAGAAWTGYFVYQRNKKKEVRAALSPSGLGAMISGSF